MSDLDEEENISAFNVTSAFTADRNGNSNNINNNRFDNSTTNRNDVDDNEVDDNDDDASENNDASDDENDASATIDRTTLTEDDALQYHSVTQVTHLLRSAYLSNMFHKLSDYEHTDEEGMLSAKNAITPDDPEYEYVSECSNLVLRIEVAKSRVFVFLRAHYSVHFPELALFITDPVQYGKMVKIIANKVDLSNDVESLIELMPSQLLVVVIACASTTRGRSLSDEELTRVLESCQEMENLEMAKQTFLEYIQSAMPLICPNLCAFLGTAITSQLFAICGSVQKLSVMESADLISLGSRRGYKSGIHLRTSGFLSNCDLVANLPPPLRPKALRLVANMVLNLARIDANRRASNNDEGLRDRKQAIRRIQGWLDPPVIRGAGHNMYERRGRKRLRRTRQAPRPR